MLIQQWKVCLLTSVSLNTEAQCIIFWPNSLMRGPIKTYCPSNYFKVERAQSPEGMLLFSFWPEPPTSQLNWCKTFFSHTLRQLCLPKNWRLMLYWGETVNVCVTRTRWLKSHVVKQQLLADFYPGCVWCPYSTVTPVVPHRLRPPAWAAGTTACLPTPGSSVTYDLRHCATPHPSVVPISSPLRPQCCLRSTAHHTLHCIVPVHSGWRKPRLSR